MNLTFNNEGNAVKLDVLTHAQLMRRLEILRKTGIRREEYATDPEDDSKVLVGFDSHYPTTHRYVRISHGLWVTYLPSMVRDATLVDKAGLAKVNNGVLGIKFVGNRIYSSDYWKDDYQSVLITSTSNDYLVNSVRKGLSIDTERLRNECIKFRYYIRVNENKYLLVNKPTREFLEVLLSHDETVKEVVDKRVLIKKSDLETLQALLSIDTDDIRELQNHVDDALRKLSNMML